MTVETTATADEALLLRPALGDERHHLIAVDDAPVFVGEDHAVRIAVEGDAEIGADARAPPRT